jgi:hypothetical protein
MLLQQKAGLLSKYLGFDYSFQKEMEINMECLFTNKHQIQGVCDEEGAEEDFCPKKWKTSRRRKHLKNL